MRLVDRWLRRAEHARRMKGDPPPTYEQLLATVRQEGEILRNLRAQCDGLIAENATLRAAALPQLGPLVVDEDVVRPYVREWTEAEEGASWVEDDTRARRADR